VFFSEALGGPRKVSFGLAQGLRTSDFGAGLFDGLLRQIHRPLNRPAEGLYVLFRRGDGLLAQLGQT
jgi:hypothetical protein